jgi:aspartate/glutamate racemase
MEKLSFTSDAGANFIKVKDETGHRLMKVRKNPKRVNLIKIVKRISDRLPYHLKNEVGVLQTTSYIRRDGIINEVIEKIELPFRPQAEALKVNQTIVTNDEKDSPIEEATLEVPYMDSGLLL